MASTKQNTPGLGIEYEVHLPAYFALLLNTNPEIEDFKLQSNVQEFGNLDDLLVDITTRSGENLYFAFQLKHKENSSKNLLPTNFEARGDFNLEKYCEAFKRLSKESRKYHFILYTNKNFDSSRTNEVQKFDMRQDECCLGRNFFDTSGDGKHLYKFEVNKETEDGKNVSKEDYRQFFSQFSLYTGQASIRDLDKSHILDILKYRECYVTYIDFFRRWHRGDFIDKILDKKTLNIHLVDIILSSVVMDYHLSDGQDGNLIFFETMVQQFDITVIDASKQEFCKQLEKNIYKYPEEFNKNSEDELIKLGKKSKLIDKFTKKLNEERKVKLLYYFFQKPIILEFHESSKDVIYEASKLCRIQENGIKLVIVGRGIDVCKFSHLKIFKNLTGVNEKYLEETKRKCNLSLQGRNISFEGIFEDEIREFVTPREIFQMLKGSFSIGEGKETLPDCYIPRTVSATVFDIDTIIKHSSRSAAIIFYYEDKFEELRVLIQKILDPEDYLYEDFLEGIILRKKETSKKQIQEDDSKDTFPEIAAIILRKGECPKKQLDEIREKIGKAYIHSFKVINGKKCLLLKSTNNMSYNKHYKYSRISVDENNIHGFFNNSINILCAQPGMGKSTLMKYLRNACDSNFWTLKIDLKAHNHFLKRNHKIEDVLNYFLELENCQDLFLLNIKKMFLEKRKIVLLFDGLDEVGNECVDTVLNITRQLGEMGFRIWMSSRQNLKQKLEQYFNIFAIEINELNEDQQKNYIENRLTSQYSENEIEEIVKKIFNNTDLANNRQILEIPLQLHIITQIFLDDKSYYLSLRENNFILTKMLEIFFEGKYTHYLAKMELKYNHLLGTLLEEKFENYEIVALHSVLDDEHFQKLQIEKLTVTRIKSSDILGIITEINGENKAVFEHLTFAEYFASRFFVKNFDKARLLKEEIFSEKYQNLLLIFNIMLAEDSSLHLAIIYKDLDRIEYIEEFSLMDKGGRNFLQVAACVATRHPPLESNHESSTSECLVKDLPVQHFKEEDSKIKKIINRVLSSDPFKNDEIFEWNSLDYALATGALYVVEAVLERSEKPPNFCNVLGKYYNHEVVAYYSIRFGYHHLLSEILAKKSCHVTGILSDFMWWKASNNSILNFLFTLDSTNRTRIVELLTSDDINKTIYDKAGYTFLHFAVFHEDTEFLNFLLQKGADVNVKDKDGWAPLFLAIKQGNFDISNLLIERGANINIKDKEGWSPLFWAVERNNLKISKLLVEKGADVNIKDKEDWSPLLWAANLSNFEISKYLIEIGADFNIKDKDGKSPLIWAIMRRNLQISKLLIEKGADVNIKNSDGESPLFWATKQSNFEISRLLVEKGADVNTQSKSGASPLSWTSFRNNLKISEFLLEGGADVNMKDKDGWSPLFWAVGQSNFEVSKLLIEKGANVNTQSNSGASPLSLAAEKNNLEISKFLLEEGADVNIKDKDGWSPLFWAVNKSNLEISKLLVEKGADINIQSEDGNSPLVLAIKQGNLEISKFLIEKGADVNIKDKDDWTPLLYSVNEGNLEILKLLVEKGADVHIKDKAGSSSLFLAVNENNVEISKLLIEKGADVNIKNTDDWTPLMYSVKQGNLEISNLLIEKGADINTKAKDGWSPLFHAVDQSNLEISKLLIEKGADVNFKIQDVWSPLFYAVSRKSLEISKLLVEKGANVNIRDKSDWSPLMYSVDQSQFEISKLLVEKGADVNIIMKDSWSPLWYAVKQNHLQIAKLLVEKGADVNFKNTDDWSPLIYSANQSNLEISKLLIDNGADVNIKNKDGWSPLFWAVNQSNLEILKLLIEKGADINIHSNDGNSPLILAVKQGNFEISKFLIEKGADVNIKDKEDCTSLIYSVSQGNLEILKLLIDKGADVNIKDEDGWSPLFWAVNQSNLEISKLLIEEGADINIHSNDGNSPLILAVKQGNFEISKFLIEKGADVNIKDKDDWTALIYSVNQGNLEIFKLLIEKGVDVNIQDKDGWSPLFFAVVRKNLEISKLLIEEGADVNIKDKDNNWSVLLCAVVQNHLEISKLLLEKGANINIQSEGGNSPLVLAIKKGNLEISKFLIEKGADVNIKDKDDWTPLIYSVSEGNLEILKLLIEKGADVKIQDKAGWSPLFWAVERNNLDILKLLIEKGADINIKIEDSWSALLYAVKQNHLEIAKLLIEKGADINFKNRDDWSPLMYAANQSNFEISKLLIDKGADVNITDKDGKSALFWAVERDNFEISKLLLERGAEVNCQAKRNNASLSLEITSIQLLFSEGAETKEISSLLRLAVKRGNFNLVQILIDKGANWNEETFLDAVYAGNIQIIDLFLGLGVDLSKLNALQKATIRSNAYVVNYLSENGTDVNLFE